MTPFLQCPDLPSHPDAYPHISTTCAPLDPSSLAHSATPSTRSKASSRYENDEEDDNAGFSTLEIRAAEFYSVVGVPGAFVVAWLEGGCCCGVRDVEVEVEIGVGGGRTSASLMISTDLCSKCCELY